MLAVVENEECLLVREAGVDNLAEVHVWRVANADSTQDLGLDLAPPGDGGKFDQPGAITETVSNIQCRLDRQTGLAGTRWAHDGDEP